MIALLSVFALPDVVAALLDIEEDGKGETADRSRVAKRKLEPTALRKSVLDHLQTLPLSTWKYKGADTRRHIGPMAQDFHGAFNVGADDKHIAVVDDGGVALAAIQGLNQKLTDELKRRDAENAEHLRRPLQRADGNRLVLAVDLSVKTRD